MCKSILTFAGLQLGNFASTRAFEEFFQKYGSVKRRY